MCGEWARGLGQGSPALVASAGGQHAWSFLPLPLLFCPRGQLSGRCPSTACTRKGSISWSVVSTEARCRALEGGAAGAGVSSSFQL